MNEKKTQKNDILWHLCQYGSITPLEALSEYGCMRLAARIADLKHDGVEIRTETEKKKNRRGRTISFARYYIVG